MTPAQLILRWQPLVAKASHRAGVPVAWLFKLEQKAIKSSWGVIAWPAPTPEARRAALVPGKINAASCLSVLVLGLLTLPVVSCARVGGVPRTPLAPDFGVM